MSARFTAAELAEAARIFAGTEAPRYAAMLRQAAEDAERAIAARALLRAIYDACGPLIGNPEDCADCEDVAAVGGHDQQCAIHSPRANKLYDALRAIAAMLGPCVCGHRLGDHNDEDACNCRVCDCRAFTLPAVQA